MLLSTRSRYGLRLLLCLGRHHGAGLLAVTDLSSSEGISSNYIHLLLGSLRASGLVRSVRGRSGGYELSRSPDDITLLEIVAALEGEHLLLECVNCSDSCDRSPSCPTRCIWSEVTIAIEKVLCTFTLRQLLEDSRNNSNLGIT